MAGFVLNNQAGTFTHDGNNVGGGVGDISVAVRITSNKTDGTIIWDTAVDANTNMWNSGPNGDKIYFPSDGIYLVGVIGARMTGYGSYTRFWINDQSNANIAYEQLNGGLLWTTNTMGRVKVSGSNGSNKYVYVGWNPNDTTNGRFEDNGNTVFWAQKIA